MITDLLLCMVVSFTIKGRECAKNPKARGFNHDKEAYRGCGYTTHSEVHAIKRLPPNLNPKRKIKIVIYIVRVSRTGIIGKSRPCHECCRWILEETEKRGYHVTNIYYPDHATITDPVTGKSEKKIGYVMKTHAEIELGRHDYVSTGFIRKGNYNKSTHGVHFHQSIQTKSTGSTRYSSKSDCSDSKRRGRNRYIRMYGNGNTRRVSRTGKKGRKARKIAKATKVQIRINKMSWC
jgi:hypothetical protein